MNKAHLTKERLKKSIEKNKGIFSYIAHDLGLCRQTVSSYIKQWKLEQYAADQKEVVFDKVRGNIYKWIGDGDKKVTLWFAERQMYKEFGSRERLDIEAIKTDLDKNAEIKDNVTDTEAAQIYKDLIQKTKGS